MSEKPEFGYINVGDYQYVAPHGDLCMPLRDYFASLGVTVSEWYVLDEYERKQLIRKRDGDRCQVTGSEQCDVHELFTRGAARSLALVPWNMICLSREVHTEAHSRKVRFLRFDPLDTQGGLVVEIDGHVRQKSKLEFYQHKSDALVREAHEKRQTVEAFVDSLILNEWAVAQALTWLRENDGHQLLGESSHDAMLASIGVNISEAGRLRRCFVKARDKGVLNAARRLRPSRASEIMSLSSNERLSDRLLEAAGKKGWGDYKQYLQDTFPATNKRPRNESFVAVDEDGFFSTHASDISKIPGRILIKGVVVRDVDSEIDEREIDEPGCD